MNKFWVIFKREYAQVVKKKSFVIGILLTPVLMIGFAAVPALLVNRKASSTQDIAIVDQSGREVGQRFAESLVQYKLDDDSTAYYGVRDVFEIAPGDAARYATVYDSLVLDINDDRLKCFVVIRPEPQQSDTGVFLVSNSTSFTTLDRFRYRLSNILSSIRLEETEVNLPVDSVIALTHRIQLETRDAQGESVSFLYKYIGAIVFVMIIFGMIMGYGQMVMRSVIEEKNSRIMEVLVSSVSPFQLMLGKVLGLRAATSTQVLVWVTLGAGLYFMKGSMEIDADIDRMLFNPVVVVFFALFLLTGYLLYSTLFALIGSIVANDKESQSFVAPISMTMILPIILAMYVVQEPNSTLSISLSLVPFLTPTMMMMRVIFVAPTVTDYSLFSGIVGQAALGVLLVAATTALMIWITAKVFRIGILMYGKRPTLPEIIKWIRY